MRPMTAAIARSAVNRYREVGCRPAMRERRDTDASSLLFDAITRTMILARLVCDRRRKHSTRQLLSARASNISVVPREVPIEPIEARLLFVIERGVECFECRLDRLRGR